MTDDSDIHPFRITFKTEDGFVQAYVAPRDSMEGAELIATMRASVLDWDPSIRRAYKELILLAVRLSVSNSLKGKPSA